MMFYSPMTFYFLFKGAAHLILQLSFAFVDPHEKGCFFKLWLRIFLA